MDVRSSTTRHTDPSIYRVALVVLAAVLPALAIAYRLGAPQHEDPTISRLAIAGVALVLFGLSKTNDWVATHFPVVTQVFFNLVGLWILYYAADSSFEAPDLAGMLLFQLGMVVVFSAWRQQVVNLAVWCSSIVALLVFVEPDPVIHPAFLLGFPLAFGFTAGVAVAERQRLMDQLRLHSASLEARVEERTVELQLEVEHRRRAELAALASSAAKSSFLTRMSHEIRTPINAIVGYTELVREDASDDLVPDLDKVLDASGHLLQLVDDVLDVSRIESGTLDLKREEADLITLAERATNALRPAVEARGNQLEVQVEGQAPLLVQVDPVRAQQIVMNLIDNARKFTADGQVVVRCGRAGDACFVEVEDTGCGIPADKLTRIFQPFAQVDESVVRAVDGVGLGLAIAAELASRLDGTLTVESDLGEGACFRLTLPSASG